MFSKHWKFYKKEIVEIEDQKKGFVNNSAFYLLPFIFSRIILYPLFLLLFLLSCKENPTTPNEAIKPPGYQEDIPWPSLADSPWPTNHGDMQRTGRSKYSGPQQGVIYAKVPVPATEVQTGVALGNDSVFYFGTSYPGKLVAAKMDGSLVWEYSLGGMECMTTPLIDAGGTIYVSDGVFIYAVNPDSSLKWKLKTNQDVVNIGLGIGKDGTLYAIENYSTLLAIKPDGTLLWQIQDNRFGWGYTINLAFSPDGNTIYIPGNRIGSEKITLLAFDLKNKTIKWKFGGNALLENGPMVDSQGNIYVLVNDDTLDHNIANFYCIDPSGNLKWKYQSYGSYLYHIDPTIDKIGNIYFATDSLYALAYNGSLRWKIDLDNSYNYSPLICDNLGNLYIGMNVDLYSGTLISVSKDGLIKWTIPVNDAWSLGGYSPAIAKNGVLVYPTSKSQNLYLIK